MYMMHDVSRESGEDGLDEGGAVQCGRAHAVRHASKRAQSAAAAAVGVSPSPCSFFADSTTLAVSSPTMHSTTVSFGRSTTVLASTTWRRGLGAGGWLRVIGKRARVGVGVCGQLL
jgi:hypothetical protein